MQNFLQLGIKPEIHSILLVNGITVPTPIQEQAIPALLAGNDVIARAQTGTGKTLAFALPIIQMIEPNNDYIQALIITPTRELALQVTTEVKKMIPDTENIHVLAVYGGQDVEKQMKHLSGRVSIVIGTPGRLLDHMRRGTIQLSEVRMLVLDEADQMLHIGFLTEVEEIMKETSPERQTMLFSATMPQQIQSLAKRYMRNPRSIRVQDTEITVKEIKQLVVETTDRAKQGALCRAMEQYRPFLSIIFCRTKRRASSLNEALREKGYNSDELHGDLSQAKREEVMQRFREARIQFLVATDVAARGLDVEGVTHVFNYDIPHDVESYIHRIGRTGRAGGKGLAVTFAAPKDRMYVEMIEKGIQMSLERRKLTGDEKGRQDGEKDKKRNQDNAKVYSNKNNKNKRRSTPNRRKSK